MNLQKVKAYLELYKENFDSISEEELYKWQAVNQFQSCWDIEADDFAVMLEESLSETKNLLVSVNYFPRRMVTQFAEFEPEKVRDMFRELYNEELDLLARIDSFRQQSIGLGKKYFKGKNCYQDHRAISVYLALNFPETHYFYKFSMCRDFLVEINYPNRPIKGRTTNVNLFKSVCDLLRLEIKQDEELQRLHFDRLNDSCYVDESLHILTQDFIYAITFHLKDVISPFVSEPEVDEGLGGEWLEANVEDYDCPIPPANLSGKIVDHQKKNAENKRVGNLGELWVLKREKQKLLKLGYTKKVGQVEHVAMTKGDGLGYDILSYDENGDIIYIEVKTTRQGKRTPFFITKNERACSEKFPVEYRLYRLYNFDEKKDQADVITMKGTLTQLCVDSVKYRVVLNPKESKTN